MCCTPFINISMSIDRYNGLVIQKIKSDSQCKLIFREILPGKKPLLLYMELKEGKSVAAISMSRDFNRVPYTADCSGLTFQDGTLSGILEVKVNSDGYTPKDNKTIQYKIRIEVPFRNGKAEGVYTALTKQDSITGKIIGDLWIPKSTQPVHLIFDCENVLQIKDNGKLYQRRSIFTATVINGKVYGARFDPPGSIVDVSMQINVINADIKLNGPKLLAKIVSQIITQAGDTIMANHLFDGYLIGDVAAGNVRLKLNGKECDEPGSFLGNVETGATQLQPGECLQTIVLYDVLPHGGFFKLFLNASGGKISHGFATSPNSSNFTHTIDVSELKLLGNKLSGIVRVILKPDSWTSWSNESCLFNLKADIIEKEIIGSYTGSANNREVRGKLDGGLSVKPTLASKGNVTLKLENALTGGKDWENRTFLNFEIDKGKILQGKISNNHTDMRGSVDSGELKINEKQISFDVNITAAAGGNVDTGNYNFKGTGTVAGVYCAGSFETFRNNKSIKKGNFWIKLPEYQ